MASQDWAFASEHFDDLKSTVGSLDLVKASEAQTRFDVIDGFIRNVLGWQAGQIAVEECSSGSHIGYVDYLLRVADTTIVIEAKKSGATFPSPTKKVRLKLSGSVLGSGEISKAIKQATGYANSKRADVVCVTNGLCWCIFSTTGLSEDSVAHLMFPFTVDGHPEELFSVLSETEVRNGSIGRLLSSESKPEDRLISILRDSDGRINRNSIADHILPALNDALYADALLSNVESLKRCFVTTEGRTRFDGQLGMHLADPKPSLVHPAPRINTGRTHGPLENLVTGAVIDHAPPVTLIIGPVGAGKTTYLKHFELISGREVLNKRAAHWIYVDFERMGKTGNPRAFLYESLREYLLGVHPSAKTDYKSLVEPAYKEIIAGLARGPFSKIATDSVEFNRRVTDFIQDEFVKVEPYVDRLFSYMVTSGLCVIILDNSDLYEDDALETTVFAEGLALSKRLNANVIVSLRDRTFVKHRNSPTFNAYELRKLWLDPPPFKAVLSKRLIYSRGILKNKTAKISFDNGMKLEVPDLGAFFEIVQRSVLQGPAGDYIEDLSDLNIRRGLTLMNNFLTSGHIQADRALKNYIEGNRKYFFPFHEVFKGTALHQFKNYRESRAECINVFDSRNGSKRTRLLRLALLNHLAAKATHENTLEVLVSECIELFSKCGASESEVLGVLQLLHENQLIRTVSAENVSAGERVVISRSGGYYLKKLCHTFVYAEECMLDTAIEDPDVWTELSRLTNLIEGPMPSADRMNLRSQRISIFMTYLVGVEDGMLEDLGANYPHLHSIEAISRDVIADSENASRRAARVRSD